MKKVVRVLRGAVAFLGFLAALLIFGGGILIAHPFTRRWHNRLFRAWADMTIWASGVELTLVGGGSIDPARQYIFVCNHQSLLDVPVITKLFHSRPRFIAKSSLDRIPFFSSVMRSLGTIAIDRNNHQAAIEKLLAAREDEGGGDASGIVFFAEGTRTSDGEIGPFKKGAVMTALFLQVPIVPMAIGGALEAFPKGGLSLTPGPVCLAIGKPIPVGENTPEEKERLLRVSRDAVVALYEQIRGGRPSPSIEAGEMDAPAEGDAVRGQPAVPSESKNVTSEAPNMAPMGSQSRGGAGRLPECEGAK